LPHPASNLFNEEAAHPIGFHVVDLKSVDSTNNYATAQVHAGLATHGMVYLAAEQTAGKGQRGRSWTSSAGQNLTMSIVLEPTFLEARDQFILIVTVALACRDFMAKYVPSALSIKWPNDLYISDRKAGGILIESISKGRGLKYSIAGIGININQEVFPSDLPNAVSLKQITGETLSLPQAARELCAAVENRYSQLKSQQTLELLSQYNQHLYMLGRIAKLKIGDLEFETRIKKVNAQGQLLTSDPTQERCLDFGEVIWIG
jgi:BirA family transcriptional regulator, biotin operon repressor / biotin---[acetyl-CoA-carboxylase] ligase